MARPGPRKVREYSLEFKVTAVRLSQQPGIQVQAVAAALDIHPFMLSRWRKQVRDGVLRGERRALKMPPLREIRRLQDLERAHALLQEEHALLKKAIRFCSARRPTPLPSLRPSAAGSR
ncbi:MAG: transposase [candidate division NC10 bacterium]